MHSEARVIKEALEQLEKANSWVQPALEHDDVDEEVLQGWEDTYSSVLRALRNQLGAL